MRRRYKPIELLKLQRQLPSAILVALVEGLLNRKLLKTIKQYVHKIKQYGIRKTSILLKNY